MRELLEKWAALEPEVCRIEAWGDLREAMLRPGGRDPWFPAAGFDLLGVTMGAIDARRFTWSLSGPRKDRPGHEAIVYHHKSVRGPRWKVRRATTPAEALLTAYLAALEAEAA